MSTDEERARLRDEFDRAAPGFAERTRGRFDELGVVEFSRLRSGASVLEVGAGTGNFLSLFADCASELHALDITPAMLGEARRRYPRMRLVVGDGANLPFASGAIDLVACAQMLHHVREPVPVLREMARVAGPAGSVLIVDSVASERFEEAVRMNELELLRDPSHAASRPPSAFRIMLETAGLELVDERMWEGEQRMSSWMWPGEFPEERIEKVRAFIETRGRETGMGFRREGDDFRFVRRRIMILARPR